MGKALNRNIAVVEDDALVRQSLEELHGIAGYVAQGFGSAEEFSGHRHRYRESGLHHLLMCNCPELPA